jgi:hypothetical protein
MFFSIDAFAHSTVRGSLIHPALINQLEIRTESQLAQENEFFSDRRLSPLYAVRGSLIINQLEIRNPTRLEFEICFSIDALAYSTRFGGSLIITQLEIRTESQLAQENEFFSDRRLSPLYAVRDYHPARDSNREPTSTGKMNFFLIDALAYLTRFGGPLIINQLEIRVEL